MSRVRAYAHAAGSLLREPWRGRATVERVHPTALRAALSSFDADTVIVHAGLSDVAAAVDGDPYEHLRAALFDAFDTVFTPGFTFSFRESGFVNLDRAPPEVGAFGRQFLADADFRTDDPVFSLLGAGEFTFDTDGTDCSFGPGGYWNELHDRDVLYLNIGTDRLRCSGFHFAEVRHGVPYVSQREIEGNVQQNGCVDGVTHTIPVDDHWRRFARRKVRWELGDALVDHSMSGVRIQGCRASAIDTLLDERLVSDPYYLVT